MTQALADWWTGERLDVASDGTTVPLPTHLKYVRLSEVKAATLPQVFQLTLTWEELSILALCHGALALMYEGAEDVEEVMQQAVDRIGETGRGINVGLSLKMKLLAQGA
jgi:hypothetical protein